LMSSLLKVSIGFIVRRVLWAWIFTYC
jgi:hypothetical protein